MWLFVDETWSPDGFDPPFGILLGVLLRHDQLEKLDHFLFAVRKKYYGADNAKNPELELKGKDLFSNYVLKRWSATGTMPKNLCVAKEILNYPMREPTFFMKLFASSVYSQTANHPSLLSPDPKKLAEPFRRLIGNVSLAVQEHRSDHSVTLVFDQRVGAQGGIAIAARRFVAAMQLPNVHQYPYFAVSTASPGIQIADICAHLFSKRIQRKPSLRSFFVDMMKHQWISSKKPIQYGFNRFDEKAVANGHIYTRRRAW